MVRTGYKQYGASLSVDRADKLESIMTSVGATTLQQFINLLIDGVVKVECTSASTDPIFNLDCKVGMGFEPIYTRSAGERIAALPPHHERNSTLQ